MPYYAKKTTVGTDRTRLEIERILIRYGATQFASGWKGSQAVIGFRMNEKIIRFLLPLPEKNSSEFTETDSGRARRSEGLIAQAWEQGCRQRWRALLLAIKAKLEAVECQITTFEEEFLPYIVMPDGKTVAEHTLKTIESAYQTGRAVALLPGSF